MKLLFAFGFFWLCVFAVPARFPVFAADTEDAEENVVPAAPWMQKFRVRAKEVPLELLRLSPSEQRSKGVIAFTAEFRGFRPKLGSLEDEFKASKYMLMEVSNEGDLLPIVIPKNSRRIPYEELVASLKRRDWVLVVGKVQSVKLKKDSSANAKVYVLMVEALYRIPEEEIARPSDDPEAKSEEKPEVKPEEKPKVPEVQRKEKPEVKPEEKQEIPEIKLKEKPKVPEVQRKEKPEVKPEEKQEIPEIKLKEKPKAKPAIDDEWI